MKKSKESVTYSLAYIIGHFIGSLMKAVTGGYKDSRPIE